MSAAITAETPKWPARGSWVSGLSAISVLPPLPSCRSGLRRRAGRLGRGRLRLGDRLFLGGDLRVLEGAHQREVHEIQSLLAPSQVRLREPTPAPQRADA